MDFGDIANAIAAQAPIAEEAMRPVVPGRCVHIDGDILAYWAGGNETTSVEQSRSILLAKIKLMKSAAGAERIQIHLTADGSTKGDRFLIAQYQPYQGNRNKGHKPKNWGYLRQYMQTPNPLFTTKAWFDREADDGFGYISTALPNDVIATRDKDMRMLPIRQLDWDTLDIIEVPRDAYEVKSLGLVYGLKWFWIQMLWGDSADHIKGLPKHPDFKRGVGEKAAFTLLEGTRSHYQGMQAVVSAYKRGLGDQWADLFVENAGLLWIRRTKRAPRIEWASFMPDEVCGTSVEGELSAALERQDVRIKLMKEEADAIAAVTAQGISS